MKKARYGSIHGPLVDAEEFLRRATPEYKAKGIFPYCDACHEVVHLYGAHTTNVHTQPRFDHQDIPPEADPLDDCILANRNPRLQGLSPDGFDDARGRQIRAQFFEPNYLKRCYGFCRNLCRQGNLPARKFRSMLRRADRKRVWAYAGIHVWAIPYILLTLENYSTTPKDNKPQKEFHFVFQKPHGTNISALWTRQFDCRLLKVFSDSGAAVKAGDNPFPVSEADFLAKSGDTAWIQPSLLASLVP